MKLRLIRHATLQIELAGQSILIDPLLAEAHTLQSLTFGTSAATNPTVPLPCPIDELLHPDMIVATHSHFDHFDAVAAARLPKQLPLICQPPDQPSFQKANFTHVLPIATSAEVNGLHFTRTGGKHGRGLLGNLMGAVSGFIINPPREPLLYIAGDTVWNATVQAVLEQYHPDIIVLNAGAAQFNIGAPITMTAADVINVGRAAPQAHIVAVHMEAVNHCRLQRRPLADQLTRAGLIDHVAIPADGETLSW